jgi:cytochrome c-type biogenesis protein CcmH
MLLLLGVSRADAQSSTPPVPVTDDQVNLVARQLYCPVCENIPLDVCPTQACSQWRGTIREKLEAGWSEQQILDYFVSQYGERVLARPSTRGLNVLIWVLPPLIVLVGGAFLWRYLRGQARPAAAPAEAAPPADEYAQRLEQELRKRI